MKNINKCSILSLIIQCRIKSKNIEYLLYYCLFVKRIKLVRKKMIKDYCFYCPKNTYLLLVWENNDLYSG